MDRKTRDAFWRQAALDGLHLFRLSPGSKRPIKDNTGWSEKSFDNVAEVEAAIEGKNNLALRPHSTAERRLVIIDCDVKPAKKDGAMSRGIVSLRKVGKAIGQDLEKWEPRVGTGPGYDCLVEEDQELGDDIERRRGLHIFMWVPANTPPLNRTYPGLPDLEFIDGPGRYVVFAGSHIKAEADGEYRPAHECSYDLDKETLEAVKAELFDWSEIPMLSPEALTGLSELLAQADTRQKHTEKPEPAKDKPVGKPTADTFGVATDEELSMLLGLMDPADYPDNDSWLSIAMAAHHATGGRVTARAIFMEWSVQCEGFDNEENEEEIRRRWDSLGENNAKEPRTARTLLREAKPSGGFKFSAEREWEKQQCPERPVIEITGDNRNEVQAQTAMVLFEKAGKTSIFIRGPELVAVSKIGEATLNAAREGKAADGFNLAIDKRGRECLEKDGVRIYPGATLVGPMSDDEIVYEAGEHIRFKKFDARAKDWKSVNAPTYIGGLLKLKRLWSFHELQALRHSPGIDFETGEVQAEPGIFASRGILSVFDPQDFPEIRNDLTREEATRVMEWVHETLYKHFPFDDGPKGASSAVNLTGAISAVLRSLMDGGAPLHAYDAPQASTGKTKLAETHGILATGTIPAMANWSNNLEENAKRLGASLRRCPQVHVYDNLDGDNGDVLQFSHLNTAITEPKVLLRILGFSEEVELPTLVHIEATGNNIKVHSDMETRVLKCRIDSGMADPSGRKFPFCPLQRAKEMRGELVSALLSVTASYIKAGRPCDDQLLNMRFGRDWRSVQGAVMWCGWEDPAKTTEAVKATNTDRTSQADAVEAWHAVFGDEWVTAKELWELHETRSHEGDVSMIFEFIAPNTSSTRAMSRSIGDGTRVVGGHTVAVDSSGREKKFRLEKRK